MGVERVADWVRRHGGHLDVVQWADAYDADWRRAWDECPRGDWLLGLAVRCGASATDIVLAAADCSRLALDCLPADEWRAHRAIELAESWAREGRMDAGDLPGELEAQITAMPDPAAAAALSAALSTLRAVHTPEEAIGAPAFAAQAIILDTGECAALSAMRYAHDQTANRVRGRIPEPPTA